MDLSLWPADAGVASSADAFNQVLASSNEQLLADDTEGVLALLDGLRSKTGKGDEVVIDLVVDNGAVQPQTKPHTPHTNTTRTTGNYHTHHFKYHTTRSKQARSCLI